MLQCMNRDASLELWMRLSKSLNRVDDAFDSATGDIVSKTSIRHRLARPAKRPTLTPVPVF